MFSRNRDDIFPFDNRKTHIQEIEPGIRHIHIRIRIHGDLQFVKSAQIIVFGIYGNHLPLVGAVEAQSIALDGVFVRKRRICLCRPDIGSVVEIGKRHSPGTFDNNRLCTFIAEFILRGINDDIFAILFGGKRIRIVAFPFRHRNFTAIEQHLVAEIFHLSAVILPFRNGNGHGAALYHRHIFRRSRQDDFRAASVVDVHRHRLFNFIFPLSGAVRHRIAFNIGYGKPRSASLKLHFLASGIMYHDRNSDFLPVLGSRHRRDIKSISQLRGQLFSDLGHHDSFRRIGRRITRLNFIGRTRCKYTGQNSQHRRCKKLFHHFPPCFDVCIIAPDMILL